MGDDSAYVRFVVTGARGWENETLVDAALRKIIGRWGIARLLLITGGAPGVDIIAEKRGENLGIHVARIHALWHVYNHAAGPVRNGMMLDLLRPGTEDFVVAFHWDIKGDSRGTRNCVIQAKRRDLKVVYVKTTRLKAVPSAAHHLERQEAKRQAKGKAKRKRS